MASPLEYLLDENLVLNSVALAVRDSSWPGGCQERNPKGLGLISEPTPIQSEKRWRPRQARESDGISPASTEHQGTEGRKNRGVAGQRPDTRKGNPYTSLSG